MNELHFNWSVCPTGWVYSSLLLRDFLVLALIDFGAGEGTIIFFSTEKKQHLHLNTNTEHQLEEGDFFNLDNRRTIAIIA